MYDLNLLKYTLEEITGQNKEVMKETRDIWDGFLKPMGALEIHPIYP